MISTRSCRKNSSSTKGPRTPRDCDEEERRERIRDAEDAVVVLQHRVRQARDPQQEVGEPVAGGFGYEHSDEARQQYQRRSALAGRDLPGRPGQSAEEARSIPGQDSTTKSAMLTRPR